MPPADQTVCASTQNLSEAIPEEEVPVRRRIFVAPWKDVAEFKKVYLWLYGEHAKDATRRRAVSQMRVWSMRRGNHCPAAVLATKVIVRVQLQDAEGNVNKLQVAYANVITRFFNFMSSIMQTHNMRTMYDTAGQLGLQSFVVDLRHICSHGQDLPPLDVLRQTAAYCMRWLHDYYWREQCELMLDVDARDIINKDKADFENELSVLFDVYDAVLESYLKGARTIKDCKRYIRGKRFTLLKGFYDTQLLSDIRKVFSVAVRALSALIRREVAIKELIEFVVEAMLKMKFFFTQVHKTHGTGEKLELLLDVTHGFFRMLALNGYIENVFHGLLNVVENRSAAADKRRGAAFWVTQIAHGFVALHRMKQIHKEDLDQNPELQQLDFSTLNSELVSKPVRQLILRAGVDATRTLLFSDTMRRPCAWTFTRDFVISRLADGDEFTIPVLKCVLPLIKPALSARELQSLSTLFDTYSKSYEQTDEEASVDDECSAQENLNENQIPESQDELSSYLMDTSDDVIYEAKDLPQLSAKADEPETPCTEFGIWTLVSDDNKNSWASCPLGRLPWE